ncbi:hypothetical protein NP493_1337g00004 [Ridgeia piscesae]|uniref:Secreted protein n=1 Tax=Ridgeia piscesae TaxID=27915 RepID=A0AAD9NEV4_RIDPI|nr:hypothetical protein NP493_1337g00004 [Ridgeia piscesae]
MRSEKWWSSWSLSLTASTLQPCRAMYWGGIEAGVPSWRLDGARGVCCSAGGAVQAALCVRPADTCFTCLPDNAVISCGSLTVPVCPSPSCPSLLLPQPQTLPSAVRARVCSDPTIMLSTNSPARAITCCGRLCPRIRHSGCPIRRSAMQVNTLPSLVRAMENWVLQATCFTPMPHRVSTLVGVDLAVEFPRPSLP